MNRAGTDLANGQHEHWDSTYRACPGMYGLTPSSAAVHAAQAFREVSCRTVVDLGAGHGRDSLHFAREGFATHAVDISAAGLEQLIQQASASSLGDLVTTLEHDVRHRLPFASGSVDGVFAHMLLCMALSTGEIHGLVSEVRRVLRPGGVFVYTVRHTGDTHYGAGVDHGDDIYEHGGFAVHFFDRRLVDALAEDWHRVELHPFEEGDLPRRLWRITQAKPAA